MTSSRKFILAMGASAAMAVALLATPAMAQNIMGPTKIISVTSTIPNGSGTFPLTQINDNITTNGPHNGFQGLDQPNPAHIGTITFTLDQEYDLDSAYLWNDINVRAEGVNSYSLKFYDASGALVGSVGPLSTVAGQVAPHIATVSVGSVKKVEMIVHSVLVLPNTYARRVEIREVAFNGIPTPKPISMPGDHYQCYRVVEGPTLKPESLIVRDQFGKAEIVLARPVMLCNPSLKVHKDQTYKVEFKDRHLVCYQPIKQSDQQTSRKVKINNQMAPATLVLRERQMFCVPSSKQRLDGKDQAVGDQMD